MELHSRHRTLKLSRKTGIVGVINVTPDSFVAGSRAEIPDEVLALAQQYTEEGADILEIGGESTGPQSVDVSLEQELERVLPAVTLLREKFPDMWIAVDTYRSDVARAALDAGADMINDITAGRGGSEMFSVLAEAGCPVVLMYAKDPSARTTVKDTHYKDVIVVIRDFLSERVDVAKKAGISQIIIDPGLGHFVSSDPAYSWEILTRLSELCPLGPVMVSPSRKSFLAGPSALPVAERLPATLAASCLASFNGASFLRTHDVGQTRRALNAVSGILRRKSSQQ